MQTYRIARVEGLIEDLKSGDLSRLARAADPEYIHFCDAVDDYCKDKSRENWLALLKSIADMIEAVMERSA